jgi:hypothetical protein
VLRPSRRGSECEPKRYRDESGPHCRNPSRSGRHASFVPALKIFDNITLDQGLLDHRNSGRTFFDTTAQMTSSEVH